jgi:hypothetical protein
MGSINKGRNSQQSQSSQSSESHLDPTIMGLLQQNASNAQAKFGNAQYTPLTGDMVQKWENPFQQQVIDAANQGFDHTRQQTLQQGHATAVGQHAFGGDRTAVLDSLTNDDFARQSAQMEAGLRSAGYDRALSTAQTENQNANQYPMLLQAILNGTYGLMGNPTLSSSQGTSSGSGSGWNMGLTVNGASGGGGGGIPVPA